MEEKKECGPECPLAHLELGQALFGNPAGEYAFPEFAEALLFHLFGEISRVYGNVHQAEWRFLSDPGFPGIQVRPYYWGEEPDEAAKPNFAFGDVEVRWYKHPGRGMSCSVLKTPEQWVAWFNDCLKAIRSQDVRAF